MTSVTSARTGLAGSVRAAFHPVLLLLSPPRSGSTALARAFWRHPAFRWYAHEPFDRAYHHSQGIGSALAAVRSPVDVGGAGAGLVIKEMTFQVGAHGVGELVAATDLPVVVTVRDPRLSVASRMRVRAAAGQRAAFPEVESGWPDLVLTLRRFRDEGVGYVVVDTTRLRSRPAATLAALCDRLDLPYSELMLDWGSADELDLGQLAHEQAHWYERVLHSSGWQAPTEPVPDLADFPAELRDHVADCLSAYRELLADPEVLS